MAMASPSSRSLLSFLSLPSSPPSLLRYLSAHHPLVSHFHWDHNAWGSSWFFLLSSILSYFSFLQILKLFMRFRKSPLPLGPLPSLYRFLLLLASLVMFVGCWQSAAVEIEETKWLWRRSKSSLEWILCLPVGTRPAGRVFFWSYIFYMSKLYEFAGTFIMVCQKKNPSTGHVLRNAAMVFMCFLWLQFSQSLQILALLTNTGFYLMAYIYSVLAKAGAVPKFADICYYCEIAQNIVMAIASIAMVGLHFRKQGCSGMEAWFFTALIDAGTLPFIFIVDRKRHLSEASDHSHSEVTKQD